MGAFLLPPTPFPLLRVDVVRWQRRCETSGIIDGSQIMITISRGALWLQTVKQDWDRRDEGFLRSRRSVSRAQVLEAFLPGVGTGVGFERDTWSMGN